MHRAIARSLFACEIGLPAGAWIVIATLGMGRAVVPAQTNDGLRSWLRLSSKMPSVLARHYEAVPMRGRLLVWRAGVFRTGVFRAFG